MTTQIMGYHFKVLLADTNSWPTGYAAPPQPGYAATPSATCLKLSI